VSHHLLLSHGLAVEAIRTSSKQPVSVGITLNLNPVYPKTQSADDQQAVHRFDGVFNRLYLDPVFRGQYPDDIVAMFESIFPRFPDGDLKTIAVPLDFLGINYYSRTVVQHDPDFPLFNARPIQPDGNEYSQMWEIYPKGFYDLLLRIWEDYRQEAIFITENGIPVADCLDMDGRVRDYRRLRYFRDHLKEVHHAIQEGVPVRGYFAWSLMDNFEWAYGYQMRFGLIYVDFDSLSRTIKESGRWFAQVIKQNGFDPNQGSPYFPC
jgi:beta-glucosidase